MLRTLIRVILVVVVIVAAAAFFVGYRWSDAITGRRSEPVVGTSGTTTVDERTARAREEGAKLGERVGESASRADALLDETRLTAKVKSKIALDDTLKGTDVSVHTTGTTVTLEGHVSSVAQHQRVAQLAHETDGVTSVVDRITVR
jgi:BON domain